jgi:uncharacterized protein (DUF1330 family)
MLLCYQIVESVFDANFSAYNSLYTTVIAYRGDISMKGYWIGHLSVHDVEMHRKEYVPMSTAAIHKFGGRFLVRGGQHRQLEGEAKERHVLVEFPSFAAALTCYHSEEYQAARAKRALTASANITVVEGVADD